jgi:hypothetical protein
MRGGRCLLPHPLRRRLARPSCHLSAPLRKVMPCPWRLCADPACLAAIRQPSLSLAGTWRGGARPTGAPRSGASVKSQRHFPSASSNDRPLPDLDLVEHRHDLPFDEPRFPFELVDKQLLRAARDLRPSRLDAAGADPAGIASASAFGARNGRHVSCAQTPCAIPIWRAPVPTACSSAASSPPG